jgi:type VI secretion system protein ImpL
MKALRTALLWIFALIVLALLSWGITLYLAWPLWASVALFCSVLSFYLLVKTLRRLLLAWRSRSIVARQRRADDDAAHLRSPRGALRHKFREAVDLLRGSSLKRLGNPLYVLPWYMVIGRLGAGKTTALARSRLVTSMKDETHQGAPVPQTQNCDWWYFDRSIVLDCAGRYVDAENLEANRREWDLVLDLLSRYRGREGINGMVLAISADRLLDPDPEQLEAEGRIIRARLDQLIRLFGKRFPVYVLVTKCDQLYGFERWSSLLPHDAIDQAMGHLVPEADDDTPTRAFLATAFNTIVSRLRALRVGLIAQRPNAAVELLLFPNELERLRNGVELFVTACLGKSPYLESPFLRGLFFSSGLQEGGARSVVLPETIRPTPVHQPSAAGLFLHDLFGRILPQDRNTSRPAALVNRWFAATQHLGMLAWLLLTCAVGVLITMSFVRNMNTLQQIQATYPFTQHYNGLLVNDAATLSKTNEALRAVDRRNSSRSLHWMISNELEGLIQKLHQRYVDNYLHFIRPAVQRDSDLDLQRFLVNDPDSQQALYVLNEIRTTNLLKAKLAGVDRPRLAAMPQPVYNDLTPWTPQLFEQVNQLRISYIAWSSTNAREIVSRVERQQATLNDAMYRDQMRWLTQLASVDTHLKDVRLADLWLDPVEARAQSLQLVSSSNGPSNDSVASGHISGAGTGQNPPDAQAVSNQMTAAQLSEQHRLAAIMVPGAYTSAGKADIDSYIAEAHEAIDDAARLDKQVAAFRKQYDAERFENWLTFIQSVPQGEGMLNGGDAWRSRLVGITSATSPYMRALTLVNDEFEGMPESSLPDWLHTARQMNLLREDATGALIATKAGSVLQTINSFGGKAIQQSLASNPVAGAATLRLNAQAATALRDYFQGVNQIAATVTDGTAKAYTVAADFHGFGVDPSIKNSTVHDAARSLARVRSDLPSASASDGAIWDLIGGPLHFVLAYTEQEASCALQSDWDSKVYWPLQSATSMPQVMEQLYGAQGSVWAFVDGPAHPFLTHSPGAISVVDTAGYSVPFTPSFLPTLNSAVGKRVAQIMATQQAKARTDADMAQAQAAQDQAKQQQANAEQALADIKQKIAAVRAKTWPLTITALPTDINASSKLRPFATVLTVQCAAGAHVLTNFNFPVSDTFDWTLGQCGEATLLIRFDNLTLTKRYRGDAGVVGFLRDFRDGHRLFTPADFPASQTVLAKNNIQQIDLHYDFRGEDAIIDGATQLADLEDQHRQQTQLRQQAIDTQAAQTQQILLIKTASANGTPEQPIRVSLPQRIGMCWNMPANPGSVATLQQRFDSLLDSRGPLITATAPLPAISTPGPITAPDVPPLPTIPSTPVATSPASGGQ